MNLGGRAKLNLSLHSADPNVGAVMPSKRVNKFGVRVYAGIGRRVNHVSEEGTPWNLPKRPPVDVASEEDTASDLLSTAETEEVGEDNLLAVQDKIMHPQCIPIILAEMQHFAGILSYDQVSHVYHWIGTWLVSSVGKPKMSEFTKSPNYFEFHSDIVAVCNAINPLVYKSHDGARCGIIKPSDTSFRGFTRTGTPFYKAEARFQLIFRPVFNSHGLAVRNSVSCSGDSAVFGEFRCDTGVLELSRIYPKS